MKTYTIDIIALKKAMLDCGIDNYFDLAKKANIDRNTVSNVINGKTKPTMNIMYAIAEALELESDEAGRIFFKLIVA